MVAFIHDDSCTGSLGGKGARSFPRHHKTMTKYMIVGTKKG